MSTLRERNKAARRTRILDAARELLREQPETPVTTERIAERAQVAPATVYNLIGPRERLWGALAAWLTDELEARLSATPAADPLARAREAVASTVDLFVEDPVVSRRMLRGWEESGQLLGRGPLEHVRDALGAAQRDGALRPDVDVGALTAVVGSACVGAMHQWAAGQIDSARFRDRALLALDTAIAAGAAEPGAARLAAALRRRGRRAA